MEMGQRSLEISILADPRDYTIVKKLMHQLNLDFWMLLHQYFIRIPK